MIIAIIIPEAKKRRATALAVLCAAVLGCVFKFTPVLNKVSSGFVIIICAVAVSSLFALIAPIKVGEEAENA